MNPNASTLFFTALLLLCTGCATLKPSAFEDRKPLFEPEKFFSGHTSSTGFIETRRGHPYRRITTQTQGILRDGVLYVEQDLTTEGSKPTHRSWQMRRIDAHHLSATANDIIGTARGQLYGNAFHWSVRHALSNKKNPFARVRMMQWMYLQPDGQTLVIRTFVKKAGITILQISEVFRKD